MSITDIPSFEFENTNGDFDGPTMPITEFGRDATNRAQDGPTVVPPSDVAREGAGADGITAWHNNQKITAMWCNSSTRNAFAAVAGMGWKRISTANDSVFVTLVALLSHAEQTNANCRLRIEADDKIHEAYVF